MNKLVILTLLGAVATTVSAIQEEDTQMIFAFELVRHGARAPIIEATSELFEVPEGILTPSGMRERYLLGSFNRERYVDEYNLISPEYSPLEFEISSTDVNRTIQSGYSELLGLYPSDESNSLTQGQRKSLASGVGLPPFRVRNADFISVDLGSSPVPYSVSAIPIYTFIDENIVNDIDTWSCQYVKDVNSDRGNQDACYEDGMYLKEDLMSCVVQNFNLTQDDVDSMNYHDFYHYCDALTAEQFDGIPINCQFTEESWEEVKHVQKVYLTDWFNKQARDLHISRIFRRPLAIMQNRVDQQTGKKSDDLKYLIYSAHDTQVDNIMAWLQPDDLSWNDVPYASTVVLELFVDSNCSADDSPFANEQCYYVRSRYNGIDLKLPGCSEKFCAYGEFTDYMDSIWYSGPNADDLNLACSTPFDFEPCQS